MEFRVEDLSGKVLAQSKRNIEDGLYFSGIEMQKDIISQMWADQVYDTMRLMGSISFITETKQGVGKAVADSKPGDQLIGSAPKNTVIIGSNTPYAMYVNEGTVRQRPRQFMQIGINKSIPKLKAVFENALKGRG